MPPPVVFVSYSHDSEAHKGWVLRLASGLRKNGVDVVLDQWDLMLGQDVSLFMQRGIEKADRVLLICSEQYVAKAEAGRGGVGYERLIVTVELVQSIDTKKFVPVIRGNAAKRGPNFLGPRMHIDFSDDDAYEKNIDALLRELLGISALAKPPLGPNPFSGTVAPQEPSERRAAAIREDKSILDDAWFGTEANIALKGIATAGLTGLMELRFAPHDNIAKSQIDLLTNVERSEIKTFGWPIGVTLGNREEFKPRPYGDGIRAEIAAKKGPLSDRNSYDYWALRSGGDFYLLQSLFEDSRAKNEIFFNTRIVRVTEALMFAASLYANLGLRPDSLLSVRVTHRGLKGRSLTASNPNRALFDKRVSHEDIAQSDLVVQVGKIRDGLVESVQSILAPMFMLFDFFELNSTVFEDIVRRFESGEVS
jgi:hypothetical protein